MRLEGSNVARESLVLWRIADRGTPEGVGIRFLAVTQNLDTDQSNPMSRFLLHILAAFAELEREMIRRQFSAGTRPLAVIIDDSRSKPSAIPAYSLRQG